MSGLRSATFYAIPPTRNNPLMENPFHKNFDHLKLLVLACSVMKQEVRQFQNGQAEFRFCDYGLHRTPENMSKALQSEINQASKKDFDGIVLGYGLCSNGVVGVRAREIPLIIPRVHDCITLFLGSSSSYTSETTTHPGTYYLTPGWINEGETPISKYESYLKSYDEETAKWILHEEMKNYTRIALIDTGVYHPIDRFRQVSQQNAEFLGITYEELKGSPILFKDLILGPWEEDFIIITKGNSIQQEMFLDG
jgi:hypothetical protein